MGANLENGWKVVILFIVLTFCLLTYHLIFFDVLLNATSPQLHFLYFCCHGVNLQHRGFSFLFFKFGRLSQLDCEYSWACCLTYNRFHSTDSSLPAQAYAVIGPGCTFHKSHMKLISLFLHPNLQQFPLNIDKCGRRT